MVFRIFTRRLLPVLADVHEQRISLPATKAGTVTSTTGKGEVQIVREMAEPFKIEGLVEWRGETHGREHGCGIVGTCNGFSFTWNKVSLEVDLAMN